MEKACYNPGGRGGGMSHWGLYIIRVKIVYFHHPACNARIAFRVSKTGKYGKKGIKFTDPPDRSTYDPRKG